MSVGIDPASLAPWDRYRLAIGAIVPRPIAWITTRDASGTVNLAPFSFFNGVTASPFIISVSIAHREPVKDTLRNLRAHGEAVVHLVPADRLAEAHASGGDYAANVSEAAQLGLDLLPSQVVAVPRLACADIALECRLHREIPVGEPATALCLLEVVRAHIAPSVAAADGLPDPERLQAPARLGGDAYLTASEWRIIRMPREPVPEDLRIRR